MHFKNKTRFDLRVVELGLVPTREKAKRHILAGEILVDDFPITKPGIFISGAAVLRFRKEVAEKTKFVSRGGDKLAFAIEHFKIPVLGRCALDIGASTGGFTDALLEKGAKHVFAVDVGHNQLAWKLRIDPRVTSYEGVNARYPSNISQLSIGVVEILVADVSFISLMKVLPAMMAHSDIESDWITLVKPQFEVGREHVGKGGIVRSQDEQKKAVNTVICEGERLGLVHLGLIESPIKGTKGNTEYLVHWRKDDSHSDRKIFMRPNSSVSSP